MNRRIVKIKLFIVIMSLCCAVSCRQHHEIEVLKLAHVLDTSHPVHQGMAFLAERLDPLHFGIMIILNLCIGICTPPVGAVLFVGCAVAKTRITDIIPWLLPFFIAMIVSLMLVTFIPALTMWLPNLLGF